MFNRIVFNRNNFLLMFFVFVFTLLYLYLINNGNMRYKGSSRYISEINKYCKNNKCLFLIGIYELDRINPNQINLEILDFVYEKYDCIDRK